MAVSFAATVAAIGGALTLLIILIFLLYFIIFQFRNFPNKDSETGSSAASAVTQEARQFRMEELEQASKHFNGSNFIGNGSFGPVFKGLLSDGTVVAIKRRTSRPMQEFTDEAARLSTIQHRNLVTLLGYCQERECQMLVFEYLPNGSICSHLYDSTTKLEFKQRLSIAIGAAKGLCHLHGLQPPLVHSNFKTSKVLVDEDFIAKVADAGVSKLLQKIEDPTSSCSTSPFNAFRDPELGKHDAFQEKSDVYSFGVFLMELISGREATSKEVQDHLDSDMLIDHRLTGNFTEEGMKDLMRLTVKCTRGERPRMENVVMDLDRILENEITRTMMMGECDATVTLGSQLFMN